MSPFMDVIRDVCHSILLKRCEQISVNFIQTGSWKCVRKAMDRELKSR